MSPPSARPAPDPLLEGRDEGAVPALDAERDVAAEALLEQALTTARAAHPEIAIPGARFLEHLAAKLPAGSPPEALAALHTADLYLACACALRDPAALATFELTFAAEYRAVLARLRGPKPDPDDFRQLCREKLFASERPKIADYSGAGPLHAWLRVTLTRTLLDATRKRTETATADEEQIRALPADDHDPELLYLKRLYAREFRAAFEEAAAALSPEDRNLLRYHFAEGLTVDQLGALYNVHRATAARRVASARDGLLSATRERLMRHLRLSRSELESVMRMIESDLHLSVHRLFEPGARDGG